MATDDSKLTLVVLLGNENDIKGKLQPAAKLRADEAISYLQSEENKKNSIVIPTGTFGAFNESNTPHGELLAQYLIKHKIDRERILPHTKSTNTLEDAYGVLRYLELHACHEKKNIQKIVVITSAFHMPRVEFIFGRVIQGIPLEFRKAQNPSELDMEVIGPSEVEKLDYLKKNWVNVEGFDLKKFPTDSYNNATSELRHYDNLSQFALTGAAVLFGLAISGDLFVPTISNDLSKLGNTLLQAFIPIFTGIALTILIFLYHKFADTAASSRRVLYTIERLYQVPGLSSTKTQTKFLSIALQAQKAVDRLYYLMISLLLFIFLAKGAVALGI